MKNLKLPLSTAKSSIMTAEEIISEIATWVEGGVLQTALHDMFIGYMNTGDDLTAEERQRILLAYTLFKKMLDNIEQYNIEARESESAGISSEQLN